MSMPHCNVLWPSQSVSPNEMYLVIKPFNTSDGYQAIGTELVSIDGCEHLVGTHLIEIENPGAKATPLTNKFDAPKESKPEDVPPPIPED